MSSLPPRHRHAPAAGFRPTITLTLVYLAGFFFVFALALVLPALLPILESTAPGPEKQEFAKQTARAVLGPRMGLAFGLAVLTTLAGGWLRLLPGLRRP